MPVDSLSSAAVRTGRIKLGLFTLTALNSYVAPFYLFYLFFLTRDEFGFGARDNLLLTALHGFIYTFASWQAGKFIQRRGGYVALKLGFLGCIGGLTIGLMWPGIWGQVIGLAAWTLPLCLIWPSLETLVTAGETYLGTARMVGRYNVVWSGANAVAFFTGGWLWEHYGRLGLYGISIVILALQYFLALSLERATKQIPTIPTARLETPHTPEAAAFHQSVPPQRFLQMAWFANPFAYVALNTLTALMPQLAEKFHLTPSQAGMFGSVWFFVRMFAFFGLWRWTGWHYRFRWLLTAFTGLGLSFATIMLTSALWIALTAQVVFGLALGLIYYSSLFYSMDVGEAKGEHGGLHEAALGLGICVGPALGAGALQFFPQIPHAGAWAVSVLLWGGLGGLTWLRSRK